jgi:hypothetical protein
MKSEAAGRAIGMAYCRNGLLATFYYRSVAVQPAAFNEHYLSEEKIDNGHHGHRSQ